MMIRVLHSTLLKVLYVLPQFLFGSFIPLMVGSIHVGHVNGQ